MNDCLERARVAVRNGQQSHMQGMNGSSCQKGGARHRDGIKDDDDNGDADDDDPSYAAVPTRTGKSVESSRIAVDVMGEKGVDSVELLKRCDELVMMRKHTETGRLSQETLTCNSKIRWVSPVTQRLSQAHRTQLNLVDVW